MQRLVGAKNAFKTLAFSPDGIHLVSASGNGTSGLWNYKTGQELQALSLHLYAVEMSFSPDGTLLAVLSRYHGVEIWDFKTRRKTSDLPMHDKYVHAMVFSPDSTKILVSSDSIPRSHKDRITTQVQIYNCSDGTFLGLSLQYRSPGGSASQTFSLDGSSLATSSGKGKIKIWLMESGMEAFSEIDTAEIEDANAEEQGETVQVQNIATRTAETIQCNAQAMTFSPDGSLLALVSDVGDVWLWDLTETFHEKIQILRGHTDGVSAAVFSSNCLLASASKDHTVCLWDPQTGSGVQDWENPPKPVKMVTFSKGGHLLGSISESDRDDMSLWDPKTGDQMWTMPRAYGAPKVTTIEFSPDGSLLTSAFGDLRLWNLRTGEESLLPEHTIRVRQIRFSADGALIVWTDRRGLWTQSRATRDRRSLLIYNAVVCKISAWAISHDGSLLAAMERRRTHEFSETYTTIQLRDPRTGQIIRSIYAPDRNINKIEFSPDDLQLALASSQGYTLLWKVVTGEVQKLEGRPGSISELVFSPDGSLLAWTTEDRTMQMWDLVTGQRVAEVKDPLIRQISFTADSSSLITNRGRVCAGRRDSPDRGFKPDESRTLVLRHDWVEQGGKRILWLPVEYRSNVSAFHENTFAIGRRSGQVSFLQFSSCDDEETAGRASSS